MNSLIPAWRDPSSPWRIRLTPVLLAFAPILVPPTSLEGQVSPVPRMRASAAEASATSVGLASADLDALADSIAEWVAAGDVMGGELLVVKDGRTVLHEAIGWNDVAQGRPLELNSIYRIRSMTKPLIGTSILMLQEEGRLSLDDPVATYLPSFDNERSRSITIRELLTHTSGLGDHGSEDIGLPRRPDEYDSLSELVDAIGAIGPLYPRGTYRYSDSGSATLAAIVAVVSQRPAERFLQQRIFEPLGMEDTRTQFAPDSAWSDRMTSTYRWSAETLSFERYWDPSRPQRYRYFRGSGGVYSTPVDYARFVSMWEAGGVYRGERFLSKSTVESALRPPEGGHYGYQWTVPPSPLVDGMPLTFGHGGSDGTVAFALPALNTMILFFTQSRYGGARARLQAALSRTPAFAAHLPSTGSASMRPEEFPIQVPLSDEDLRGYTGRYAGDSTTAAAGGPPGDFTFRVWEAAGHLRATLTGPGGQTPAVRDLIHVGGGRFALGRIIDGEVMDVLPDTFVRFAAGQVTVAGQVLSRVR